MDNLPLLEFFDGESINNNYFLLGNSQTYIIDIEGKQLKTKECLDFLFNNAGVFNYFFRIDYDINMIFKTYNDKRKLNLLFSSKSVKIYDYEIIYFRHKILSIKKGKIERVFYDIFNFFNKSFIEVIKILKLDKKFEKEYKFISEWKLKRDKFTKRDIKKIIEYNKTECQIGLEIVKTIYNLLPNELKTYKLYGSSSITNIYMKIKEIDKKINNVNIKELKAAYYGGRMECFKVGFFRNVYRYDINSAYPYIISKLRQIISVEKSDNLSEIVETDLYKIYLKIEKNDFIGLLPVRLKNGLIVYPNEVSGFYFGSEVKAVVEYAKKYDFIKYKILKRYKFNLGNYLFDDIEKLYKKRLELKKKKDLRQIIYKILLNSIYGKFAQKIGKNIFNNYYYAGFITSSIRAKLLIDFIDYWNDIIFIATDGVLIKTKNPKLVINENLGNYSIEKFEKAYIIMSGVYYLFNKNKVTTGERGFKNLKDYDKVISIINKKGKIETYDNAFITIPYAIKNYKKFGKKRCNIITISKILDIKNQLKRIFIFDDSNYLSKEYESLILDKKTMKEIEKIQTEYLEMFFDFNLEYF